MAWREFFAYAVNFAAIPAGTGAVFTPVNINIDSDSDFEFQKTAFLSRNGQIRLRYLDNSAGRYLMRTSVMLRDIGGNFIGTPFIWPRPYQILAGTTLSVEAADASGVANQFLRLVFHGAKVRAGDPPWGHYDPLSGKITWKRYKATVPFVYNTGLTAFAANGVTNLRIEVDNDAHFLIQKITGFTLGRCLLDFSEAATNKSWQNIAIPDNCYLGNGQFPNVMFSNRFIARGSVVNINVQDISGVANQIEINLIGVKLFE